MKFYEGWRKTLEEREEEKKKMNVSDKPPSILENALYHHEEGVEIFQALSLKMTFGARMASHTPLERHEDCTRQQVKYMIITLTSLSNL